MSLHNVRVPPDSSGKRVLQQALIEISYGSGTAPFVTGDRILCASSAIAGVVVQVDGGTLTGTITVNLDDDSPSTETLGEAIEVASISRALLTLATPYFVQSVVNVSAANALNGQIINDYGASLVAFAEGQPTLTADGGMRTGTAFQLGRYSFIDSSNPLDLWSDVAGTGATTHAPVSSTMLLQVGSDSGARANLTTVRYHSYLPGVSQAGLFSLVLGDSGKAGNVREWGYGDNLNGLFWTMNGTDLGVTVRSDTSGAPVDTFTPRADWNGDPLDGTGQSRFVLDVSKRNIFWIDFLWLGSGAVRFGVYDGHGRRLVAHTAEHVGVGVLPYMSTATLPLMVSNRNTAATASTTELRLICMSVEAGNRHDYVYDHFSDIQGSTLKTITTETPVLSIRPKTTVSGKVNRIQVVLDTVSVLVIGGPVRVDFLYGVLAMTGAVWSPGEGSMEYDVDASAVTDYTRKSISLILAPGAHNIEMLKYIAPTQSAIGLHPDGVTAPVVSCVLTKLVPADTVTALAGLTHREHRI